MHQPHQSEPVKSSMTSLFSDLAFSTALGTSVNHCSSSAPAFISARPAHKLTSIFFIQSLNLFRYPNVNTLTGIGRRPRRFVQRKGCLPTRYCQTKLSQSGIGSMTAEDRLGGVRPSSGAASIGCSDASDFMGPAGVPALL